MSRRPRITVLLGDPSLPYPYNPEKRFNAHDLAVVAALREALTSLDHWRFEVVDDHRRFGADLTRASPRLVLNFCNSGFGNRPERQLHVPALLEMLDIPYAGAGPACLALCHDKHAVMRVAADLGVPVAVQACVRLDHPIQLPATLTYPAFIKPNSGDGSTGVTADAVVADADAARAHCQALAQRFPGQHVLMERYLPGPEYSVGLIGNPATGLTVLPPLAVDFTGLPPDRPPILTEEAKVAPESADWQGVTLVAAALTGKREAVLRDHASGVFERLDCRDYARQDWRCDADGTPHLIDVNAHPMWGADGMMATMAGFAGHDYAGFIELIIDAALRRLEPR